MILDLHLLHHRLILLLSVTSFFPLSFFLQLSPLLPLTFLLLPTLPFTFSFAFDLLLALSFLFACLLLFLHLLALLLVLVLILLLKLLLEAFLRNGSVRWEGVVQRELRVCRELGKVGSEFVHKRLAGTWLICLLLLLLELLRKRRGWCLHAAQEFRRLRGLRETPAAFARRFRHIHLRQVDSRLFRIRLFAHPWLGF